VVDPTVDFLARLTGAGPALELGIGTGRIALPLSRRGLRVHGIEVSPAMVVQLDCGKVTSTRRSIRSRMLVLYQRSPGVVAAGSISGLLAGAC
jgi:Methyltransferase domain